MKIVISHPTGNANVRAAAKAFAEKNVLETFNTSIALFRGGVLHELSRFSLLSEMGRREFDRCLRPMTKTYPAKELGRLISSKISAHYFTRHESGIFSIEAVYRHLDKKVARSIIRERKVVDAVYAYEDGAIRSFENAKKYGISCLYDLPTGHWRMLRQILKEEAEKKPEWTATLTGIKDSEEKLSRKDNELLLADQIFVASRFTASSLRYFPNRLPPIHVIPYGFPPVFQQRQYEAVDTNRKIKLLFVGKLSQQKGIAYVFEAVRKFKDRVSLTVIGTKPTELCEPLNDSLKEHRWIPSLPHDEILLEMRSHDVLVFPSLFDGFGLVISEAMSQGTPVIATERCAGPDLIEHNVNGWLTEAGNSLALERAIEAILERPKRIISTGKEAMQTAAKRPWSVYMQELADAVICCNKSIDDN